MPVPPKSRMPLRYRAQYSDRVSVYREFNLAGYLPWWRVGIPDAASDPLYVTFDEAVHEAHRLARVRAERDRPHGEHPPIATIQALMQAAWA